MVWVYHLGFQNKSHFAYDLVGPLTSSGMFACLELVRFDIKLKIASKSTTLQWPNFVTHQNESTKSSKGQIKVYTKWYKDWIGKKRISLLIKFFHNRKINKGIEHGHSIMTLSNSDLKQLPPFLSLAIKAFHWMNCIFLHFDCILIFRCFVTCMIKQPTFYLVLIQVQMYGRAEELKMREGEEEGRGERGESRGA